MSKLLVIESSANLAGSVSRDLTQAFLAGYRAAHADATVLTRDLVADGVPHLGVDLLGGLFAQPEQHTPAQKQAIALSDTLIGEIEAADIIVIGAPMYNFGIPSALKAWIDHIVRAGRTFRYTESGPQGLVTGKKVYLLLASGGVYSDGPYKTYDFQEPYLRAVLGFIGLTDVTVVRAEGIALGAESAAKAAADAKAKIAGLAF